MMSKKKIRKEAHAIIEEEIDELASSDVLGWLNREMRECRVNASRGLSYQGKPRGYWQQRVAYFAAAIGHVDWTAAEKDEKENRNG